MINVRFLLLFMVGCSSLVSDPCRSGFTYVDGACIAKGDDGTYMPPKPHLGGDIGPVNRDPDPIDPLVCDLPEVVCAGVCKDLSADPDNCGHCGRVCSSGICAASTCVGDVAGHIVAIGHDYTAADPAMDRVLGNAVDAGGATSVRVGWWQGSGTSTAAKAAAHRGLAQTSRSAFDVTLAGAITGAQLAEIDALVIAPQTGDGDAAEAAGTQAQAALAAFLASGHVVVVLETVGGVSYRYAAGAMLFAVVAPVDATGTQVTIVDPADYVAAGVVSPYLAKTNSVGYPGVSPAVVVDGAGDAVVFDLAY